MIPFTMIPGSVAPQGMNAQGMNAQRMNTEPAYAQLAQQFAAHFPDALDGPRTVGREAEFPIVTASGRAADVRQLWPILLDGGDLEPVTDSSGMDPRQQGLLVAAKGTDYTYALEVGLGTVEVNTGPCADLFALKAVHERAVMRLVKAAAQLGWMVLGYGIQPVSPASPSLMSPKARYQALLAAMGRDWLPYTATASDQVQIDICRPELVTMLNVGNLIAPVLVALCANSAVAGGRLSPYCSAREGRMAAIRAAEHRHGLPDHAYRDMTDFVRTIAQARHLIQRTPDGRYVVEDGAFAQHVAAHGADFPAFLFHEHYVWNSARIRTAYATVELRPACQQPWAGHMLPSALGLGLIQAAPDVWAYLDGTFGGETWTVMRHYHRSVIKKGLAARQPVDGFLDRMVDLASAGLASRGLGEEIFLDAARQRLAAGENPAQTARRIFMDQGMDSLLAAVTLPDVAA